MALDKALSLLAIQQYNNSTIVVVTGSLYLVGEIREFLIKNPKFQITNPK